jgi:hypothetical protein
MRMRLKETSKIKFNSIHQVLTSTKGWETSSRLYCPLKGLDLSRSDDKPQITYLGTGSGHQVLASFSLPSFWRLAALRTIGWTCRTLLCQSFFAWSDKVSLRSNLVLAALAKVLVRPTQGSPDIRQVGFWLSITFVLTKWDSTGGSC